VTTAEPAALPEMDRKVLNWLGAHLGRVTHFAPHPRWRTGWDAEVERDGVTTALHIRGPRGDNYMSPVDMRQEAAIHGAYLANGIPAPRVLGVIDDPYSLVLERIPGRIDTVTIVDPDIRRRVREDFVAIVARLHQLPVEAFAETGLPIPRTPDEIGRNLYAKAEAIFRERIGRPWPLMRFIAGWLRRNVPLERTRAAFINCDAGQFLFEGDRVTGLIDFELSCYGDPAAELAGLRLRDTSEPLGALSELYDHYERLTGDRITKRLIEYHTAGFCGVNGFMLWPLMFGSTPEQDYVAYMQFAVATSRWSITAIAEHIGMTLAAPSVPDMQPLGFDQAGLHLVRQIGLFPAGDAATAYARDSAAALALYQQRWLAYGRAIQAADLADAEALLGHAVVDRDAEVEAFVLAAGPQEDARLVQHFHNWLRRQDFLLTGCGPSAYNVGLDLQPIAER
jgi:aminoglycoside phosphotransferase (APT) family kinase protein